MAPLHLVAAAALSILLVELVRCLPLGHAATSTLETVGRSLQLVGNPRISDHWKERALAAYARVTLQGVARIGLMLALVLGVATLLVLGVERLAPGFLRFMLGWGGIAATLVLASLWAVGRRRWRGPATSPARPADTAPYGAADRLLHRLALDSPAVATWSFRLDQERVRRPVANIVDERHVFVSGLARAGTTILMRRLHASGAFRSLTYRDMPFVLAPGLWRRVSSVGRRELKAAERAHGDRIRVDLDSPESLDEVFWRIFDGPSYIRAHGLIPHDPPDELVALYRAYVNAILWAANPPARRYLAKNNNGILRLAALRRAFPHALVLVPFRDPLDHAASLFAMHQRFLERQRADPFVRQYMGWLGHHEFGADHRPFLFGPDRPSAATHSLDAWLERWIGVYAHLEARLPPGAVPVCYEDLCADPAVWARLAELAEVPREHPAYEPFVAVRRPAPAPVAADLLAKARALYDRLRRRAAEALRAPAPHAHSST
ncbi:MAG: sulfotransferase [Sphingomonadaceae bacterium]|uniref:sulfotransferase n=1 Tax=Thermaurantiacus sp. TaxID=2820283 RepID=UPI00298F38DC|nr:sulfotransferase [Thermaurantiacus sp.]MCS6987477.1 sulfotransferase [Sphingomonadaceae bacterium]MDW8415397.1 sulfotransferase [Thermaurantiacus sp.]